MTYPNSIELIRAWVDDATRSQAEINTILGKGELKKLDIWLPTNLADILAQHALIYHSGDMSELFSEIAIEWLERDKQPVKRMANENKK
ncbi:MAG: hypothetical protein AAGL08_13930 [Cyanobacteria bacterium J06573_11]